VREEHGMTMRYHAASGAWMVVGQAREDQRDDNWPVAVRYDRKTEYVPSVPICDALGGHVGWVSWEQWTSWPIIETKGEST
jgi:hypothetical protein